MGTLLALSFCNVLVKEDKDNTTTPGKTSTDEANPWFTCRYVSCPSVAQIQDWLRESQNPHGYTRKFGLSVHKWRSQLQHCPPRANGNPAECSVKSLPLHSDSLDNCIWDIKRAIMGSQVFFFLKKLLWDLPDIGYWKWITFLSFMTDKHICNSSVKSWDFELVHVKCDSCVVVGVMNCSFNHYAKKIKLCF